jgi:hypothetical protein
VEPFVHAVKTSIIEHARFDDFLRWAQGEGTKELVEGRRCEDHDEVVFHLQGSKAVYGDLIFVFHKDGRFASVNDTGVRRVQEEAQP